MLGDEINPKTQAKRQVDKVKASAGGVRERVMGSATDLKDSGTGRASDVQGAVSDTMSSVQAAASSAPSKVRQQAQGNPLAAGLIGAGIGALAASLLPTASGSSRRRRP